MHDWPKLAIFVQTCLESSKRPRPRWGRELTTRPLIELRGGPRGPIAHLKDLMFPQNICFERVQDVREKLPPEIVSWWLRYRCFIAIGKCYYVLTLHCKKILLPEIWLLVGLQGGPKNFLGSLSLAITALTNFDVIRPLPRSHSRLGRGILPIPHPFDAFGISGHLRRLELGPPPTFQASYAPAHCKDKLNP